MIRRDHPFLLFLVAMMLAHLVYFAFEVVLPISAVDSHGLTPAAEVPSRATTMRS